MSLSELQTIESIDKGALTCRTAPRLALGLALPHQIQFTPNLVGLWFPLMKILPALKVTEAIEPGRGIIETSSGTMALALAMVCAAQNRGLTLVTPPLEAALKTHLCALGQTNVVEVAGREPVGGNQAARLRAVRSILERQPELSWVRQYENPLVPEAYEPVGTLLAEAAVDYLVTPVGSGGSALGMIRPLRRFRVDAKLVAVDAINSVLFGRPDGPRRFSGMGNSIMPAMFDHTAFDEVHWLSDDLIAQCTLENTRRTGLLLGPSGGSAFLVAQWLAQRFPNMRVAFVMPDQGTRYLETLYADAASGALRLQKPMSREPTFATSMSGQVGWQAMQWRRRPLQQ